MIKKGFLVSVILLIFITGCAPATPAPTATPTAIPTNTPAPTATVTPIPTATNTPQPTATSTPIPTATPTATATIAPDLTAYAKYFRFLGLTKMDGMTEAKQLKAKEPYCLRHATTGQIEKVADAIIALADGSVARAKAEVYDGLAMGVMQRGDRSSCTGMPDLKPGKYLYQVFVADALVAALPFEIIP